MAGILDGAWSDILIAVFARETRLAFAFIIMAIIDAAGSVLTGFFSAWSGINFAIFTLVSDFTLALVTSQDVEAFGRIFAWVFNV